jgi:hypothetical protein
LDDDGDAVGQLVRSGGFDALLVCRARRKQSSPVLSLAVRLARVQGLAVDGDTGQCARKPSWLRRVQELMSNGEADNACPFCPADVRVKRVGERYELFCDNGHGDEEIHSYLRPEAMIELVRELNRGT